MEERQYDLIFICRPDTPEADIDKVIATLEHAATEKGAKIEKTDKWGRKRMAYRVQRLREGFYVYMVVRSSHGEVVKELERRLKVADRRDQVPDRARRRGIEAAGKTQEAPRTPRRSASAQDRAQHGSACCADRRHRTRCRNVVGISNILDIV